MLHIFGSMNLKHDLENQFQSFQLIAQFSSLADFMFCIDNLIVPLLNCHLLHKYVSNVKLFMPRRL